MPASELTLMLAALFAFVAVRVGVRCLRARHRVFDRVFTPEDRRLAGAATFYWLVPAVVLAGAAAAAGVVWLLGAPLGDFAWAVYWCHVAPAADAGLGPVERATVAATPGLFCLAVAIAMVLWTRRRPHHAAFNFVRLELARILVGLALILQPLLSLLIGQGAFHTLRTQLNLAQAHMGDLVVLAYGVAALLALRFWRSERWQRTYLWLATPLFDSAVAARARIERDARDTSARIQLARSYLAAGNAQGCLRELDAALEHDPGHARAGYLAGIAALKAGDPQRAAAYLREAGQQLETSDPHAQEELRFELVLALSAARLALGDAEGALLTIEEASDSSPREPRAMLLHADALLADGQPERARDKLEAALRWAHGPLQREIRRRLSALG